MNRHLGSLVFLPSGHFFSQKIRFLEHLASLSAGKKHLSHTQWGMLSGEFINLHLESLKFHEMTDTGNSLSESERPELIELSLSDSDLLADH